MSLVSLTISSDKINVVTPCTMRRLLEIARTGENLTLTTGHSRNLSLLLMIILAIMAAADDHSCNLSLLPMIILPFFALLSPTDQSAQFQLLHFSSTTLDCIQCQ